MLLLGGYKYTLGYQELSQRPVLIIEKQQD